MMDQENSPSSLKVSKGYGGGGGQGPYDNDTNNKNISEAAELVL
jgi:hypothetical protein